MSARLIAIAGSLKGMVFALPEGEASVGRVAANPICLNDPSVSRRHCVITKEAEEFKVTDLESFNGTFVNGVPIREHLLKHGDQIAVGDILLLFLMHETDAGMAESPIQLDGGDLTTRSTIRLRREDAFYLYPEKVLAMLPPTARVARDLNALLKISTVINSVQDVDALQTQLLELILDVIPAERGALILTEGSLAEQFSITGRSKLSGHTQPVFISRTVVSQVLGEGVSILSNDIFEENTFNRAESLIGSQIRSLLCVQLAVFGKPLGVIYLDTSDEIVRFDEADLQLLTAISGITAVALENARRVVLLEGENDRLHQELGLKHHMIGESAPMRELYKFIGKIAPTDSTVLILGESGTGKELAARAIHMNSPRAHKPFVAINCATLTEALLESELFGHERGAFTGAVAQKRGKLEIAHDGTVFLDEVGELSPVIQAKLLRVLQEREFERVGGEKLIKVNIRIIAATNKDLRESVRAGIFRQDLYFRLNVISFSMPPLRERREDIPLLANYFAAEYSKKSKRRLVRISLEARSYLMSYNWPGNVRELENTIERAIVLGTTDHILSEDLPETILDNSSCAMSPKLKYYEAITETKKQLILNALGQASGNFTEAAKLLGVHPNNLHRLIRNMNIRTEIPK